MTRRALLIGINQYEHVSGLKGCGNDVSNVFDVVSSFAGFETSEVRAIAHERATKAAIEARLEWLVADLRPGDLLFLHFSGHGSQVRGREGNELDDGLDEILCPYDMSFDGTYITDDYLREKLQVPDGVVLEVILDACHSGAGATAVAFPSPTSSEPIPNRQPRYVQPPVDIVVRHARQNLPINRLFRSPTQSNTVLWSACADSQTAADAEIDGVFHGAFTFYFCKHLRESQGALSRAQLLDRVKASLVQGGYAQIPELSAPERLKSVSPFHA